MGFWRPTLFWSGAFGPFKRNSPQGETLHPLASGESNSSVLLKKQKNHTQSNERLIKLQLPFQKKDNALASHALRKICSAVKKAALSEQSIKESLSNHYPIMNTTKETHDHCNASLPLLG